MHRRGGGSHFVVGRRYELTKEKDIQKSRCSVRTHFIERCRDCFAYCLFVLLLYCSFRFSNSKGLTIDRLLSSCLNRKCERGAGAPYWVMVNIINLKS